MGSKEGEVDKVGKEGVRGRWKGGGEVDEVINKRSVRKMESGFGRVGRFELMKPPA